MDSHSIIAVYRLQAKGAQADARARGLALEQSIEMPTEAVTDPQLLDRIAARVIDVTDCEGGSLARLALSTDSVGTDAGQLLNMLFGNCSLQPDVELVDVDVPAALACSFGGPNHGIDGLRELTGARGRPLTATALKPIGSSPAQLAQLAGAFAHAGIDLIKDDHGWADQDAAPFNARVTACQRAIEDACEDRHDIRTRYAPSLFGSALQMHRQLEFARPLGVRCVLIAPMVCGVATLNELKRSHPDFVFIAHPALAGGRIAPRVLLGKLFRLFGADAVVFPNHSGRFSFSPAECQAIAAFNRQAWHGLNASMPVPAGGMTVERVAEMKREYGDDCVLLIGGSLLAARAELEQRSRAFVQAVAEESAP